MSLVNRIRQRLSNALEVKGYAVGRSRLGRRYDWAPSRPDINDIYFRSISPPVETPNSVDLISFQSEVQDQGIIGSCTGNASANAAEYIQLKQRRESPQMLQNMEFEQAKFDHVSRMMLYNEARKRVNMFNQDSGAFLRDIVGIMHEVGVCREDLFPYVSQNLYRDTPQEALVEASAHKISTYARIRAVSEMEQCLAQGNVFVGGFTVYESIETDEVTKSGLVLFPQPGVRNLGGHAVMWCGYDRNYKWPNGDVGIFWFKNSWGPKWGRDGYGGMSYSYMKHADLVDDTWALIS